MRSVVWLLLLFAAAVVAALALGDNDGLVSVAWGGWRIDMSLNFFLLMAMLGAALIASLVQGWNAVAGLPARARAWQALKHERQAQGHLREALAELFGGRYSRAVKAAQRAVAMKGEWGELAEPRTFEVLAQLVAAAGLHRLQDKARRDETLRQIFATEGAASPNPAADGARLLAAEWALDDRDGERAQALLAELPRGSARRTQALRLKLHAHRLQGQPLEALRTARLLANHQAFSAPAAAALLRTLAHEVLLGARDGGQLRQAWAALDASDRADPALAALAARCARDFGLPDEGLRWLLPLWDKLSEHDAAGRAALALALADLAADGGAARVGNDWLARVEKAQRQHGQEPAIQAAAGAVMMERQLWGMARRPLELAAANLGLQPSARRRAWRALARLAQQEGDAERAAACERAAAAIDADA